MGSEAEPLLVTGANGHLGQRLIRAVRPNRPVHALVRSERAAELLRGLPEASRPRLHVVAYDDEESICKAGESCKAWVHLVGILKQTRAARYEDAHERSCASVARAAARAGAERIVYLSILGSDPDSPNACLASKGRAETILREGPVPTTVLRVPMVLGPGEIAASALRGQAHAPVAPLVRGGASLEQPIDSEDVVQAIALAVAAAGGASVTLDLAGPESLPHRELLMRVAALYGKRPRILPVPIKAARWAARVCERWLANPPLTEAMLDVLEHDDCIDPTRACVQLGLELRSLDATLERTFGAATA